MKELRDEDIEKIIGKECPNFPDAAVKKIIFLSKGYPYIARSLAYICDKKNSPIEMLEFLNTLRDNDIKYNLDRIHKEVLETLGKDGQNVIKKLALAPQILTLRVIEAFCGDDADDELSDILERGILRTEKGVYWIYHPLFRDYLRSPKIQPIAVGKRKEIYLKAMEKVKSEFDSIYILLEVMNESDIFKELIQVAENYDAINRIGIQSYNWGELNQAILIWFQILKKSKEAKDKKWESIIIGNIGVVYRIKGELDNALEYHMKSLELDKELGRKEGVAANLVNVGIVYASKREFDKALAYFERALELAKELQSKEIIATLFVNIGNIYLSKKEFDPALEFYSQSLKIHEELGINKGIAANFANIGNIYKTKRELDRALEYYEKSLKILNELEDKIEIARIMMNIGDIFFIKSKNERALDYYLNAQDLAFYSPLLFSDISKRINELLGIK